MNNKHTQQNYKPQIKCNTQDKKVIEKLEDLWVDSSNVNRYEPFRKHLVIHKKSHKNTDDMGGSSLSLCQVISVKLLTGLWLGLLLL